MPKILEFGKFVFYIFVADKRKIRDKFEPRHIHVISKKGRRITFAKIWLEPEIKIDDVHKGNFSEKELNKITKIMEREDVKSFLNDQLDNFYNDNETKFKKMK